MRPTILISGTIAATTRAQFTVERAHQPVTVFAAGLAGTEKVTIQLLKADTNEPASSDFFTITSGGADYVLDVDTNVRTIVGPGTYQLVIDSSAGAVAIGIQ